MPEPTASPPPEAIPPDPSTDRGEASLPTADRTLILSDLHMGRLDAPKVDQIRPLWQGFDRLVVNGDLSEPQVPAVRAAAYRELLRLVEVTQADGVTLAALPGNHDTWPTTRRCMFACDERVLIMHGDALHPALAPWSSRAKIMIERTGRLSAEFGLDDPAADRKTLLDRRLALSHRVAELDFAERCYVGKRTDVLNFLCQPARVARLLRFWSQVPSLAEQFLDRYAPGVEVLVFGHSHRQGVWRRGRRVLINTGSYTFPGRPRAVVIEGDRLAVHSIQRRGDAYGLASHPRFSHAFAAASEGESSAGTRNAA